MSNLFRSVWPTLYSKPWQNNIVGAIALISAVLYLITVIAMVCVPPGPMKPDWTRWLLILWAVVPPAWFWFEYYFLWKPGNSVPSSNLDAFKYGQEVSRNIWLAFVALLAALYFK